MTDRTIKNMECHNLEKILEFMPVGVVVINEFDGDFFYLRSKMIIKKGDYDGVFSFHLDFNCLFSILQISLAY